MAGYITGSAVSTQLQDLNRVLLMGAVTPARSLSNIPMDSDAGLALNTYRSTLRAVAAKGWWFNTDLRVWHDPDGSSLINLTGVSSARASNPRLGEEIPPKVRLEVAEGAATGSLKNLEDDNDQFSKGLYLDLIRMITDDNLPQEFREYCILKAGRQFATLMGLKVDRLDEVDAFDALDKAESANSETSNLLNYNAETAAKWIR